LVGLSIVATLISAVSGDERLRLIRLHRPPRPVAQPRG
jgi:hypothetical protein